jgi:small subunit ribosomal protein S1
MSTPDAPAIPVSSNSADNGAAAVVGAAHAALPAAASTDAIASAAASVPGAADVGGANADVGDANPGVDGDVTAEGAEGAAKKRRRRRRGKKPGADGIAASGEGTDGVEGASEAAAAGQPSGGAAQRQPKKKRENRPPMDRERPPFGVGDIVFGKVIDVTEDVLVVDLSGKATGLFDLRELLIPDDESQAPVPDDEDDEAHTENVAAAAEAATPVAADAVAASDGSVVATGSVANDEQPKRRIVVAPSIAEGELAAPVAQTQASMAMTALFADAAVPADAGAAVDANAVVDANFGAVAADAVVVAAAAEQAALPRVVLEIGAQFVGVIHNDGGRGGYVVLTHHADRYKRAKAGVAQAAKDGTDVLGIVTGVIRGGVEVDIDGLRAFAPASHMDLRIGADLGHHVGNRMTFTVTQYGRRGRDVVLSRRNKLEGEAKALREKVMATVQIGAAVDGIVRSVVTFGAFIDIGGVEGLVPLTEMSHNRSDQPRDIFTVGETIRVVVQRVDERGKIWLSHRATLTDPWGEIATKYAEGTRHSGTVSRLHPAGAFVELEPGIDGMIRLGDLSIKRIENASEVVKEGEAINVIVAYLDRQNRRISLHRAPEGAAADEAPQKLALHKSVKVQVVAVEAGGLVVRIMGVTGWQARGFVPAMATGTPRGTELKKPFPVGKELDAKVIELDPRKNEVKLSIRAHAEDNERNAYQQYRAQVKREAKFGTFADLLAKRGEKP